MDSSERPSDQPAADAGGGGGATRHRLRVLLFDVGGRTFATPAEDVHEVVPFRHPTRLPLAPPYIAGVLNLRGTVVTVIDLAARLGLDAEPSDERCIVMLQRTNRPVGIVVDSVRDVVKVDDAMLERSEEKNSLSGLSSGIVRFETGPVVLLDTRLLASQVLLS